MPDMPKVSALQLERGRVKLFQRLYAVTSALTSAVRPDDVVNVIFTHGLDVLGADSGFLGKLSDDGRELDVRSYGATGALSAEAVRVPVTAGLPIAATARDGRVRIIESNAQLECDYPGMQRLDATDHACATFALSANGHIWGAINIGFSTPRPFTDVERHLMVLLTEHCNAALDRTHTFSRLEQRLRDLSVTA